jgi:glycine/D-amino acid oxidase-like deaminating enzyme
VSSKVVIVGGGVIGSSIAYFLRASDPTVDVTVIECDPSYAKSSSALSAASIRQQFSTPLSIQMSLYGIECLRGIGDILEVEGFKPARLTQGGGGCFLGNDGVHDCLRLCGIPWPCSAVILIELATNAALLETIGFVAIRRSGRAKAIL